MFPSLGMSEIILILVIALIFFGPKQLPEVGRALGKTMNALRNASMSGLADSPGIEEMVKEEKIKEEKIKEEKINKGPVQQVNAAAVEDKPLTGNPLTVNNESDEKNYWC